MVNYYKYRISKSIPTMIVTIVFGLLMGLSTFITRLGGYYDSKRFPIVSLDAFSVLFFIEAFALAYLEFSSFRNKRNLDTWFSFPLSREKIAMVHMANVFTIYAVQTFVFSILGMALMSLYSGFNYLYFIVAMFAMMIYYFLVFCFISATFLFGNSVQDGALSVIGWINLPSAITSAYYMILSYVDEEYYLFRSESVSLSVNAPINSLITKLEYLINERNYKAYVKYVKAHQDYFYDRYFDADLSTGKIVSICVWAVLLIVAAIALPKLFSSRPTEKIAGVSDFFLCFDFLIPFYTLFFIAVTQESIVLKLFFIPTAYVAYCYYRKSPKITIKRFIVLIVLFVIACIPFLDILGISNSYIF